MLVCPDVVKADVPSLLVLDALDQNRVQALRIDNELQFVPMPGDSALPWSMPVPQNLGLIFLPFIPGPPAASIFYQHAQLTKLPGLYITRQQQSYATSSNVQTFPARRRYTQSPLRN